jgi:hypothetical protein
VKNRKNEKYFPSQLLDRDCFSPSFFGPCEFGFFVEQSYKGLADKLFDAACE